MMSLRRLAEHVILRGRNTFAGLVKPRVGLALNPIHELLKRFKTHETSRSVLERERGQISSVPLFVSQVPTLC